MSDPAKIVPIREGAAPAHHNGEPDQNVVGLAEDLLERARSGELRGLVAIGAYGGGMTDWRRAGLSSGRVILGCVSEVAFFIAREGVPIDPRDL